MMILALGIGVVACEPDGEHSGNPINDIEPTIGGHLPEPAAEPAAAQPGTTAQAIFAGGCFWCTEAVFEQLAGVRDVVSGYAGGDASTANYKAVTTGSTGHAEAIRITYDPAKISFGQLLKVFFATHDPTQLNRQGPDVGTQYRSAVFYESDEQKRAAADYIARLNASGAFDKPVVTTLEKLETFHVAEDYHQDYARLNPAQPYIRYHAMPKVDKVRNKFGDLLKDR